MNIATSLSPDELREAIKLNRNWKYWGRLFLANWYMTILLIVIVAANIARVIHGQPLTVEGVMIVLIPLGFLAFTWARMQRTIEKSAEQLSDAGANASIGADGIHVSASSGATSFTPWSVYSSWREGSEVFTLNRPQGGYTVLPKRELAEADLQQLRELFRTHIN